MGSFTGAGSYLTLKMRLTPLLTLIVLSCLLVNLINAQRSGSRLTSKRCKGSTSPRSPAGRGRSPAGRGSTRCQPCVGRHCPMTTTTRPTSTSTPKRGLPTKRRKTTGTSKTSRNPPKKRVPPKKRRTTTNRPGSQTSEESEVLPDCTTDKSRARRSLCTTSSIATTTTTTPDYVNPSNANSAKHYLDPTKFKTIETEAAKGQSAVIEKLIDELGPERFEELTKDIADRTPQDEIKNFAPKNTVLSRDEKFDLANDYSVVKGPTKGKKKTYTEYRSKNKVKFIQITWKQHQDSHGKGIYDADNREEGHFEIEIFEEHILIGVDDNGTTREISHLVPETAPITTTPLTGKIPFDYKVDSKTPGAPAPAPAPAGPTGKGKGKGKKKTPVLPAPQPGRGKGAGRGPVPGK